MRSHEKYDDHLISEKSIALSHLVLLAYGVSGVHVRWMAGT